MDAKTIAYAIEGVVPKPEGEGFDYPTYGVLLDEQLAGRVVGLLKEDQVKAYVKPVYWEDYQATRLDDL